ncbi:MAG: flagellar hook-associated protein FlgK [Treponemataceae bacterium]|nr:flagellar hook-associated protein FlgK [Spirochaetales bacterium]MDY6030158.1 flagellar hook-associated protein FlgK [Treponemataceae bacterium]
MANSFAGIELGKRSLMAQSMSISTAGHNISNADTEGYSRQRVNLKAMDPLYRPDLSRAEVAGQIGQGITAESIERVRDEFLDSRIVSQSNQESYWKTRDDYYYMLEGIYNEPYEVSVRSNMDKFWQSWQELSVYPESKNARQAVVTRGETLVNSIKQRYEGLAGVGNMLNNDIEGQVKQVNSYVNQIAEINVEIEKSKAMGDNPNDLLDRRDLLVEKLSSLVNVTKDNRDSDEFMIHVDGHVLVQGSKARNLGVQTVTDGSGFSKVVWQDTLKDAEISGGSLGALIELRDVDVRNELQSLNTMTMNFMDLVNNVHRNAVGANGVSGIDFFVEQPCVTNSLGNYDRNGDGTEDTSMIFRMTGSNYLVAQDQVGIEGKITLAGRNGNVEIPYFHTDTVETVISRINDSESEVKAYLDKNNHLVLKATTSADSENPDFVIRHVEDDGYFLSGYAGLLNGSGEENAYDFAHANAVESLVQNSEYAVAPVLNPSGYIAINDRIKNDVLSVGAGFVNRNGIVERGDGTAALEIASLRNTSVMIGENKTFDDYFAESVTNVGLKGEQAMINHESQIAVMDELRTLRDSISGVNIDEELADIIKFQHGYNAAAKYISVIDEMLDTIINRLGV